MDAQTDKQWTPLHFAAQNGHTDAINALVAAEASVYARESKQWTPLHLAAQNGHTEVRGSAAVPIHHCAASRNTVSPVSRTVMALMTQYEGIRTHLR